MNGESLEGNKCRPTEPSEETTVKIVENTRNELVPRNKCWQTEPSEETIVKRVTNPRNELVPRTQSRGSQTATMPNLCPANSYILYETLSRYPGQRHITWTVLDANAILNICLHNGKFDSCHEYMNILINEGTADLKVLAHITEMDMCMRGNNLKKAEEISGQIQAILPRCVNKDILETRHQTSLSLLLRNKGDVKGSKNILIKEMQKLDAHLPTSVTAYCILQFCMNNLLNWSQPYKESLETPTEATWIKAQNYHLQAYDHQCEWLKTLRYQSFIPENQLDHFKSWQLIHYTLALLKSATDDKWYKRYMNRCRVDAHSISFSRAEETLTHLKTKKNIFSLRMGVLYFLAKSDLNFRKFQNCPHSGFLNKAEKKITKAHMIVNHRQLPKGSGPNLRQACNAREDFLQVCRAQTIPKNHQRSCWCSDF